MIGPALAALVAALLSDAPSPRRALRASARLSPFLDRVSFSLRHVSDDPYDDFQINARGDGRYIGELSTFFVERKYLRSEVLMAAGAGTPAFRSDRLMLVRNAYLLEDWRGRDVGYAMYLFAAREAARAGRMLGPHMLMQGGNTEAPAGAVWERLATDLPSRDVDLGQQGRGRIVDGSPLVIW